jgi:tetratricopeptide (TPR) repeat protein
MILRYFFVVYLLLSSFAYAQEADKLKALELQLKKTDDVDQQLDILENLWKITAYDNAEKAIDYAKQAISIAEQFNLESKTARAYERLGIAHANISEYYKSNEAYIKAIELHIKQNKPRFVSSLIMNQAINFKDNSEYDSALYYMEKSTEYMDKEAGCCKDDTLLLINYNSIKAQIYMEQGKYLLSLDNAVEASRLSKMIKDSIQYADNLAIVGDNNQALNNNDVAIKYLKESLLIYKDQEDTYYECLTSKSIGELYSKTDPIQIDSARFYLEKSINLAKAINVPLLQMQSLNEYGEFLLRIKDYDKAQSIFNESLVITNRLNDEFSTSRIKLGMGHIALQKRNYSEALKLTNEALALKEKIGLLPGSISAHKQLSDIFQGNNNHEAALREYKIFNKLSDSLYNKEKATRFDELQTKFDTQKKASELLIKEEEIKTLNAQAENDKLTKTLYAIGMISFLAIAGLLYFGFKQRLKRNRIEREKQEEIYKQEIAFKKKELASQTLHLVQKNTFIQELKENLEKIKKSPELFKVEFRRLVMLLKKESAEDKDWEVFKSYFSEVHNNFDNKIKSIASDITEKEIRLASFLRMNLSTKEIASMLNVLPDSVLKSKYRLKKKLALDKEDDLTQFLNSL